MNPLRTILTLCLLAAGCLCAPAQTVVTAPEAPFEFAPLEMHVFPAKDFSITKYGAKPDNVAATESTEPILETPLHDTGSTWYAVGSFFLPIPGLIAGAIFKHHKYFRNWKSCRKGAFIGLGILGAIILLFLIFLFIATL